MVPRWTFDLAKRRWERRPNEKVWVHRDNVNPAGDTKYHGPKLVEVVAERREAKAADKKKMAKRVKRAA